MRRLRRSALGKRPLVLLAAAALSVSLAACRRGRTGGESRSGSFFSGGDVADTTVRFGRLDTTLLTNGAGWTRQQQGVAPPEPHQRPGPPVADTLSGSDSGAPPRRDTTTGPDSAPPPRQRDSTRARTKPPVQPDTTKPDSLTEETRIRNQD